MPPIPPELKAYLDLIQWLLTGALAVFVWLRKPGEDAGEAVTALRRDVASQVNKVTYRLIAVEEHIKHVPTSDELAELEGTVKTIASQTHGLAESMQTMRVQLNRIEGYLLNARDTR
jgi:predicted  nucleic acid-binding Zn-ribbon protein